MYLIIIRAQSRKEELIFKHAQAITEPESTPDSAAPTMGTNEAAYTNEISTKKRRGGGGGGGTGLITTSTMVVAATPVVTRSVISTIKFET